MDSIIRATGVSAVMNVEQFESPETHCMQIKWYPIIIYVDLLTINFEILPKFQSRIDHGANTERDCADTQVKTAEMCRSFLHREIVVRFFVWNFLQWDVEKWRSMPNRLSTIQMRTYDMFW